MCISYSHVYTPFRGAHPVHRCTHFSQVHIRFTYTPNAHVFHRCTPHSQMYTHGIDAHAVKRCTLYSHVHRTQLSQILTLYRGIYTIHICTPHTQVHTEVSGAHTPVMSVHPVQRSTHFKSRKPGDKCTQGTCHSS